jgi:hypothetical protein
MVAACRGTKAEKIRGSEYLFLTVMSLRPLKSIQGRRVLSFLATKKNPAPMGEEEGADECCREQVPDVPLHILPLRPREVEQTAAG